MTFTVRPLPLRLPISPPAPSPTSPWRSLSPRRSPPTRVASACSPATPCAPPPTPPPPWSPSRSSIAADTSASSSRIVGQQTEADVPWSPETTLPSADQIVTITMQGRQVIVRAWRFDVVGITGHIIPVFLLDTDVEGNDPWDRRLTDHLYGGDTYYRLCQETVLGLGGIALLHALGCKPEVYHMNEGHAALLAIGLLEDHLAGAPLKRRHRSRRRSRSPAVRLHHPHPRPRRPRPVRHRPDVPGPRHTTAPPPSSASAASTTACMNMTYIALRFSRYVNGVAMQHGKVSQQMFPDYKIHSITNGVHAATWLSAASSRSFSTKRFPHWRTDNQYFRSVYGIDPGTHRRRSQQGQAAPLRRRRQAHRPPLQPQRPHPRLRPPRRHLQARQPALARPRAARRTSPKRSAACRSSIAGKAHPADNAGKGLIRDVFASAAKLNSPALKIYYLENYDWELGALLTQGVDVWVNTPRRPYEASGTSGMKAALNGVPSLSILDGWWIEGCAENTTGWAIEDGEDEAAEAASLYDKLEKSIAPMYANPSAWARMQQHCIAINGTFFNTHRMLGQYFDNSYFPPTALRRLQASHLEHRRSTDVASP